MPRMLQVGFHGNGLQDGDLRVARTLIHLGPEFPIGPAGQPVFQFYPWSWLHQTCLGLRQEGWLGKPGKGHNLGPW